MSTLGIYIRSLKRSLWIEMRRFASYSVYSIKLITDVEGVLKDSLTELLASVLDKVIIVNTLYQ